MKADAALQAYFSEAAAWDADRVAQQRRVVKLSFWVAGAGWLCAIISGVALMLLMPLEARGSVCHPRGQHHRRGRCRPGLFRPGESGRGRNPVFPDALRDRVRAVRVLRPPRATTRSAGRFTTQRATSSGMRSGTAAIRPRR